MITAIARPRPAGIRTGNAREDIPPGYRRESAYCPSPGMKSPFRRRSRVADATVSIEVVYIVRA
jgi:hypothetical protein